MIADAVASADAGYNKSYVWAISFVAALGGLLFGYDWVVIGGAKPFYEKFFALNDPSQQGWAMSCALVGCLLGALASGPAADRWGRKGPLIFSAFLFAASSIATGLAPTFSQFILYRIAGGVAIGLASSLSPLYIAEVSPAAVRGRLVSLNQFTVVIGILLAQLVNWQIAEPVPAGASAAEILASWNGQLGWRWMFGVTAVPAAFFLLGSLFIPESPRWLAGQGRGAEALGVLGKICGTQEARAVLNEIESSPREDGASVSWRALLGTKERRILALGIVLAVFQQWCGINVIFNYAEEIFSNAGYAVSDILFNIVITGTVNVVFTVLALDLVERVGRRPLMLGGALGLCVIYTALGACYAAGVKGPAVLVLVLLAIACYAATLAPVAWVMISEIFPNRIRGLAMSLAVTSLWIACFVLTFTFPLLNKALGAAGTFWIYAGICAAGFAYIFLKSPETKGRTLEEIERAF